MIQNLSDDKIFRDFNVNYEESILFFKPITTNIGFLAILFGSAKLIELFLKLFLVKRLLRIYGLQAGLLVLIFVLLLTTSSGLL